MIIAIEGIIGSGKSTFAEQLSTELQVRLAREPVESNPFLEKFYADPARWALAMQLQVFETHRRQLYSARAFASRGRCTVLDRSMIGDAAFIRLQKNQGNFTPEEYDLINSIYASQGALDVDAVIYLDCDPDLAFTRIATRARGCELAGVTLPYLRDLREYYERALGAARITTNVIVLDASRRTRDLVAQVVDVIRRHSWGGAH